MTGEQSFLKGAAVLTLAGISSRLIGAVFRIALARYIGDNGIGIYQMAYPIYSILLIISTAGIPIAVSKLVSENLAVNNYYGALRIFKTAVIVLALSGMIISLSMYMGAELIANHYIKNSRALIPIMSISPAIFFVAVMSAFRGFFQGQRNMVPTGVSQIIEQISRVAVAFPLALFLLPRGLEYSAGGAVFGAVVGAILGLIFLIAFYFKKSPEFVQKAKKQKVKKPQSFIQVLYKIASLSIPITLGSLVLPLVSILDLSIVNRRLLDAGFTLQEAEALYGHLTGMAGALIQIPAIITISLAASLVPSISEALTLQNQNLIRRNSSLVIRFTLIMGLPAALGLYLLAEPITTMLFKNPAAAVPLRISSMSVIFLTLYQTTTGILHGLGKTRIPVINMFIGAVLHIVISWTLTAQPHINIRGAALATLIGFAAASMMNLYQVEKLTRIRMNIRQYLFKPLTAVTGMGLLVHITYNYLNTAIASNTISTIGAIAAGALSYGLLLFLTGSITADDLRTIPRMGSYLIRIAESLHILRG